MENILNEILNDCDPDIREWMLADSTTSKRFIELEVYANMKPEEGYYKNWQVVEQPALVALYWQQVRNYKNCPVALSKHSFTEFQAKEIAELLRRTIVLTPNIEDIKLI